MDEVTKALVMVFFVVLAQVEVAPHLRWVVGG